MGIVNGSLELGYKNTAWFTANPTLVLKEGQIVYLEQTGTYKIGNGTSTLSALSFLGVSSETQTLQNVTDLGNTTTNSITANGFVKSGGTASQFLKANGSVDSTTYLSTQVVPVGGTTGQILAKVDDTDYNLEWIENYANYTSVLKHEVKASVALTKGQAVYVSGASGTNMLVSKASNVSESTSSKTLGLIAQDLAINGQGFVITEGLLSNINTNSATIGDPVWLGVDGALIYGLASKPYAPAHLVFIGIVTRVSGTVGEIFVKVQNGFELREIHDVDLITTSPSNNEILTFESSTSLWKNKSVVSALGFTPYNATNPSNYISGITSGMVTTALGFTPYNSTNPSGYITGITSGMVTTALGFTPYNATNPSGYITSSALTPYAPLSNPTFTTAITTPIVNGVSGNLAFANAVQTSGAITAFTFTKPNNTGQTGGTQINGFVVNGGTRQWNSGNIGTQSENVWGATTYSFVGTSTITNAYGNVFNAPIAGTNCTITTNWAARFNGAIYVDSPIGAIFDNSAGSNFLRVRRTGGTIEAILSATGSGAFVGSSTAHSTNIQSAGVVRMSFAGVGNGDCTFADGMRWICGSILGNTFASTSTEKIAFWGSAPIVRPTTSVTASTFVSNTSMILNDTATFDGYTIGQVVKALRNMGLLA